MHRLFDYAKGTKLDYAKICLACKNIFVSPNYQRKYKILEEENINQSKKGKKKKLEVSKWKECMMIEVNTNISVIMTYVSEMISSWKPKIVRLNNK